jgi:iron complex outermembrane receptor protein
MTKIILTTILALVSFAAAAELSGRVTNFKDGEPLAGVQVTIARAQLKTTTTANGRFKLTDIPAGKYVIEIVRDGYSRIIFEHDFSENTRLHKSFELRAQQDLSAADDLLKYILDEVTVLTTRASADHPVTHTNLSGDEIQARNSAQDLPLLFSELPNLNAYSDGGNGVGYSYLRMRGFSQNRIAVQLNGVPLNDALSHEVFWIDLPDFAEDLADIQVQRGVGASLYGPAALGGSINLATRIPGVADVPKFRSEISYGTWNTRRASVQFQSGRIQNRFGLNGRLTRIESDGYRNGSWSKLWSYFLSAARFTPQHSSRTVFYGGPERLHLAYEGITDSMLQTNRRFNPLQYPGEVDNFFQPHYEFHDDWKLSEHVSFNNTLYAFQGDGYYDQFRPGSAIASYVYDDTTGAAFDILRRRNITETDWGFIPRLTWEHARGAFTVGAETRRHHSHHEGFLLWANPTPSSLHPDYKYYDYRVKKQSISGFIHELYKPFPRTRVMVDLQAQSHRYELQDDQLWNVTFARTFNFLNPRTGIVYELVEPRASLNRPALSTYANLSFARREPAFADLYDPQDYYSLPISAPNRFRATNSGLEYIGPQLKPEKLTDFEFGLSSQWKNARLGANYYYMLLRDEIIPYAGQLDDNGVPVSGNAEQTLHAGIELVGAYSPVNGVSLDGNFALVDHRFIRYREFDWASGEFASRDGKRLAYDAAYLGNLRLSCDHHYFSTAVAARFVGKQFVDNTQNTETAVREYATLNLDLSKRFDYVADLRAIDVHLRIANLLDHEYENFGYSDFNDGQPRYIPAAPRSIQLTAGIEF